MHKEHAVSAVKLIRLRIVCVVLELTFFSSPIGKDQKADRNLGAWEYISFQYAERLQGEVECSKW